MAPTCCCHFGKKLDSKSGSGCRISAVYEVMIVLLSFVVGGQRAVAAPSPEKGAMTPAFHSFHLPPWEREQQQHHYSQSRWKDLARSGREVVPWRTSDGKGNVGHSAGLGLTLVHRDARDSPFRADLNSQATNQSPPDFATIFDRSLQRDAARVRALDSLIAKRTSKQLSRRVHAVQPPLESPLFPGLDWGSGEYFTTLSIGTPPTEVLVTIDTGSDLLWLQCRPCESCYDQIDPIFDSAKSTSFASVPCRSRACARLAQPHCEASRCKYLENYGDGSFSTGDFASETITMNSTGGRPVQIKGLLFGCGHDNEGLFTASAGLLGLGRGSVSFPSQLSAVLDPRFSYCLTDRFPAAAGGAGDGDGSGGDYDGDGDETAVMPTSYLFFGEIETEGSMRYTALLRNPTAPSFYYLQLTGVSVGNEMVEIPASALELDMFTGRGGVILDTGTAVTRFSSDAYGALRDAFRLKARHLTRVELPNQQIFDSCYQLEDGETVPSITMHFAGSLDLALPMGNTVIPVDDSGSLYCLAFARSEVRGGLTIIGNVQQQGFRIAFDLLKGQVGFTQQGCSLP